MRIISIILMTFLTIFSTITLANEKEITDSVRIPEGLKDCKFYRAIIEGRLADLPLFVVRCSGNDTISTGTSDKNSDYTTLIESHHINEKEVITLDGKKYIKKDELIKNTKTINLNGFEYIELK